MDFESRTFAVTPAQIEMDPQAHAEGPATMAESIIEEMSRMPQASAIGEPELLISGDQLLVVVPVYCCFICAIVGEPLAFIITNKIPPTQWRLRTEAQA